MLLVLNFQYLYVFPPMIDILKPIKSRTSIPSHDHHCHCWPLDVRKISTLTPRWKKAYLRSPEDRGRSKEIRILDVGLGNFGFWSFFTLSTHCWKYSAHFCLITTLLAAYFTYGALFSLSWLWQISANILRHSSFASVRYIPWGWIMVYPSITSFIFRLDQPRIILHADIHLY